MAHSVRRLGKGRGSKPAGGAIHSLKRRDLLIRESATVGDLWGKKFRLYTVTTRCLRQERMQAAQAEKYGSATAKKRKQTCALRWDNSGGISPKGTQHAFDERDSAVLGYGGGVPPQERKHHHHPRSTHFMDANTIPGTYRGYHRLTTETRPRPPVRRCSDEWCCRSWTKRRWNRAGG